jgi:hypothetical protein
MTATLSSDSPALETPVRPLAKRSGSVRRIVRGALQTRRGKVGLTLTLLVVGFAFIGPFVPARSSTEFSGVPYTVPGNGAGILGTDALGRDVLARVLEGGWALLLLATISTVTAVALGAVAGVVAAYRGRKTEMLIMRSVDVMLAIPQLVFVLLIVSVMGARIWLLVVAVTLAQAPQVARVMYAAAQDICERDFVKAVALWGVPPRTVIRRHDAESVHAVGRRMRSATELLDHSDLGAELSGLRDAAAEPILGGNGERESAWPGHQFLGRVGPRHPAGGPRGGHQRFRRRTRAGRLRRR